jgi:hypothetical protein
VLCGVEVAVGMPLNRYQYWSGQVVNATGGFTKQVLIDLAPLRCCKENSKQLAQGFWSMDVCYVHAGV